MADFEPYNTNDYKIKLRDADHSLSNSVTFDVTPDLIENRNVNYKTIDPIHAPGQIYVYSGSSSRTFNISNARFVSRNVEEATRNLKRLWLLRSWGMPSFGKSTITNENLDNRRRRAENMSPTYKRFESQYSLQEKNFLYGKEQLGKPPEVLLLSAYSKTGGNGTNQSMEHINRVPVVIQQLSIPYPSDVDYIPTENGTPMPTIMTIDLTLVETHSPKEYENFSINDYRNGILKGF